jgi:hypothetical protein
LLYVLFFLTRGINSVINRHCCCNRCFGVWHVVSTLWSIYIVVVIRTFASDTWYQLMSIYHRVDTTCQTQKYVLQQQCLFITELIPPVRHKSTYYNNNVYFNFVINRHCCCNTYFWVWQVASTLW